MKMFSKQSPRTQTQTPSRLAQGIGWFSIGLGLAELIAPKALSRLIGVPNRPIVMALLGIRELASGIGILSSRNPADWLWSRVGGDVIDLSLLGAAMTSDESDPPRIGGAVAAVLGATALDVYAAQQYSADSQNAGAIHFRKTITINREPEVVYNFWRSLENLPRFMHNLESVTAHGLTRSHWVAKGPGGQRVQWDAELLEDVPNHRISWRSLEGSDVDNCGSVRFEEAPGHRGTIVRVDITYHVPGGRFGAAVAKLFGKAPDQEVQGDLFRFKQVMETGHVVTTEGQSAGRSKGSTRLDDLARH